MIDTTANLVISKSNEVFLKINTEPHIEYELRDHFKFEVPNAKFMPQYRGRNWNGEIHLYDMRSKQIYVGLLDKIVNFCEQYGYSYKFEDNKFYGTPYEENEHISEEGVKDYMNSICAQLHKVAIQEDKWAWQGELLGLYACSEVTGPIAPKNKFRLTGPIATAKKNRQ